MLIVRQQHCRGDCYTQLARQSVVEELVVGGPPKRIIDDNRSRQRGVFKKSSIKGNVLGNAINNDAVSTGIGHLHSAQFDELRSHLGHLHAVDLLDQRRRESVFHAENDSDLFHAHKLLLLVNDLSAKSIRNISQPSSATKANRARCDLPKYRASAECLYFS